MSAKHTPAPWRVEGRTVYGAKSGHIISHGVNSHGDGPEGYVCNTSGTSEADAQLIAAAPDLLKALTLITEMDGDQPARSDWDMVRIARTAIAKATGAA
jgi:hypothetical protein